MKCFRSLLTTRFLKTHHLSLFIVSFVFSSFFFSFFIGSSASALGITRGVNLSYSSASSLLDRNAQPYRNWGQSGSRLFNDFGISINDWWGFDLITNETIPANSIVSFTMSFSSAVNNDSIPAIGPTKYNGVQFENGRTLIFDSCMKPTVNYLQYEAFECSYVFYNPYDNRNIQSKGKEPIWELLHSTSGVNHNVVISAASAFVLTNDGLSDSDRAYLQSILSGSDNTGVIAKLDELEGQQIDTNEKLDTQIQLQQEANEQQQEQYEAEKEEESERESEQSDSMDELSGVFSFTAFNPFSPVLELFGSGDSCVDIPVLASWLHLDNDEVCPMFPLSVRQVLTPIFGISSMMILFGFFVRWLGGTGGDNSLDVGDDNGYFRKGL